MRIISAFATLFFSFNAFADNISCTNVDEYWEEDTLEFVQEGKTTYAYYFDNDSYMSIACETTALDGYVCEDGSITVTMYESGETIVEHSDGSSVDFMCH